LKAVRSIVGKAYGYMNNHADAKSVANAIELKRFLDQSIKGDYTPEFVQRYPELSTVVRVAGGGATEAPVLFDR
jgi:hypothetical protein